MPPQTPMADTQGGSAREELADRMMERCGVDLID